MKKKLVMILALAMVASLTACGGGKKPATSDQSATTETQEEAPDEANKPEEAVEETTTPAEETTEPVEETAEEPAEAPVEEEPEAVVEPIEAFTYSAEIGSHNVTLELIKLDEPLYAASVSSVGAAYRDGKAYVATDGAITIYDIDGNAGTVSQKIEYAGAKSIDVGSDGSMFLNGGVFGAVPVSADGTAGSKIDVSGALDISVDGSFGMAFFSSDAAGKKVSINGTDVALVKEISFPEVSKIYCISAGNNEIIVGGKLVDGEVGGIAVYDADGGLKYQVPDVPSQNNYIDVCATDSGVIGVTPGKIGFGDKEGNTYEIKVTDIIADSLWPVAIMEAEDGSVIIAGSVYKSTGEVVFIRMTGF